MVIGNQLYQSKINPVKFVEENPTITDQYHTKHMDDWQYVETIDEWIEKRAFAQPWQTDDIIALQFRANYGGFQVDVIDCRGIVFDTYNLSQLQFDPLTGFSIYQADYSPAALDDGIYYLKITGAGTSLISEPLFIQAEHPDTILLEYGVDEFYEDIIFKNTNFAPSLRTYGKLRYKQPASKSTQYEDQPLNLKVLDKVPYRLIELIIGGPEGVPDYFIDKIDRILGCSLRIDGHGYTQVDGKWEEIAEEGYPMRAWKMDVRESLNRSSVMYDNGVPIGGIAVVVANVSSKGFGTSIGGNIYSVYDID